MNIWEVISNTFSDVWATLYSVLIEQDRWKFFLTGTGNTLLITLLASILGIILGVMVASVKVYSQSTGRMKLLNWLCSLYTTVIRGTPVVVQLLIIYYMIFRSATTDMAPMIAALAFGINSGAYVAETVRGGINSIDRGQTEAGRSLGLNRGQTMRLIVLPQAVRNILPALFNEFIMLLKETSVAGWIAVTDLTRAGDIVRSRTFGFAPLLVTAAIYLVLVLVLTRVQQSIERRLAASDRG